MASPQSPKPFSCPGTLHFVPPNLSVFEPTKPLTPDAKINTILWIGGMSDTPLAVAYPLSIARALDPTWSLTTASLASTAMGWGACTVARDADDMARLVAYVRELRPGGRIVLMGHSTGCQDCMEYLTGRHAGDRPPVDGVILQAPVSDRQALTDMLPQAIMEEANALALKMCGEGKDADFMPARLTSPAFEQVGVTARRWVDVASPGPAHDGADDFFSSDLADDRLEASFGRLPRTSPLLVLFSGADAYVPASVDKRALVKRWTDVVERHGGVVDSVHGGVVPDASHNLNGQAEPIVRDLVDRVAGFVERLGKGELRRKD